jgi:hypothetical protein
MEKPFETPPIRSVGISAPSRCSRAFPRQDASPSACLTILLWINEEFHHILVSSTWTITGAWVIVMKKQGLLGNQRFLLVASLMLAFSIVVAVSRILLAERLQTITIINDVAAVMCALIATVLFVRVWLSTSSKDISKKIWRQIAGGMVVWTMAEAIWAYYEVILGEEVPYPSLADLFWLFGYVMFYVALLNQYRLFQTTPTQPQKLAISLLVIVFSLIGSFLVLIPIIESFDPQKILESLLNIAYPLFDLILLILTLAIIFSLEQGRFALTWRLLGVGLVFMSTADFMFSYASWNEIYFPEGHLNGITLLIDTLYYVAYLTLGLGAYTYGIVSDSLQSVKIDIVLRALTKSNILVFTDRTGTIISVSDNFSNLVRSQGQGQYVKTSLSEALHIDQAVMADLLLKTIKHSSLSTQPMEIRDWRGALRTIWLTSLAVYDEQRKLVCIAMVLRTNLDLQDEEERSLSEEQKMLVNYYLTQAGTYRSEENQVIKTYFLEQIRLLYSLIQQFSGVSAADKLMTYLNQVVGQNDWHFTFMGQEISIPEEYEGETLADRLSTLLQEAKNFAVNMINLRVVEQEMRILDNNLSMDNLRYVDKYGLRGARIAS